MTDQLDDIDNRIIALLMEDARMPVATIARRVAIARTTAIARIGALDKRGVIAGYGLRLTQAHDVAAVRAYVGINLDARSAAAFLKLLEALPEVETLCAVSGSIDYMLTVRCLTTAALDALLDRIGAIDGVRQTATSIILARRIDRRPLRG
jgi:DNA-binding Lrp family transcriptional regulator